MTAQKSKPVPTEVEIVDGLKLPYNQAGGKLVPIPQFFVDNDNLLHKLVYAIQDNHPILLIGETGTGKTSAVRYMAWKTNNNFRRLNLNGQTTVDEFVGKIMINEKGTYWVDGVLTEALREGYWLVLDELNSALPEVLFVLQSLLDDDRYIVLSDKEDKEIVRPHPNFRLFATMNPSDGYVGTKDMNKALMSRFSMVLSVGYPPKKDEIEIINQRTGIDKAELDLVVDVAQSLRESYKAGEMDFILSTRDLIAWANHQKHFNNWVESAYATFMYKCNEDDRSAIDKILKLNFKQSKGTVKTAKDVLDALALIKTGKKIMFKTKTDIILYKTTNKAFKSGAFLVPQQITTIEKGPTVVLFEVVKNSTTKPGDASLVYSRVGTIQSVELDKLFNNVEILES